MRDFFFLLVCRRLERISAERDGWSQRSTNAFGSGGVSFITALIPQCSDGIEDGFYFEAVEFLSHAVRSESENNEDRHAAGFCCEPYGATQKAFAIELQQLFWLAEARGCSGGEHDSRACAGIRHS